MPTLADPDPAAAATAPARPIDPQALARTLARWQQARDAPWLHGEVARRMAERLVLFKTPPRVIVDWSAVAGGSASALAAACPNARVVAVAASRGASASRSNAGPASTRRRDAASPPAPWWTPARWRRAAPALDEAAVPAASADLVWANMLLHALADPPAAMRRWREALAVGGYLMFSTLGPDTLAGLRSAYREAGWGPPHAAFTDMHDLGDLLVEAGFADPVMDQERLHLSWATPEAMLAELRTLGVNADPCRHAGLRTPRWRERLHAALREQASTRGDGRIGVEFELVYGHAFQPPPRAAVSAETRLPLDEMRRMVRGTRKAEGPPRS